MANQNPTIEPRILEHYRMLRAYGQSAQSALYQSKLWAARPPLPAIELEPYHAESASWQEDGFKIVAKLEPDYDADLSYLGEYCNANTPGAIPRNPDKVDRNSYSHFLPANSEYGKADLKIMEAYNDQEWSMYGVVVTVYKKGVELGESSVWGVQSDSDKGYFVEVAADCASEALDEAKKTLAGLCAA